jgi:predicted O-methyltransferase YrrM
MPQTFDELKDLFIYAYNTLGARHQLPSIAASLDDTFNFYTQSLFATVLGAINIANSCRLEELNARNGPGPRLYKVWPGEHYRLLYGLCKVLSPKLVIEIGTDVGMGAATLLAGMPKDAQLISFDMVPWTSYQTSWLHPDDFNSDRICQYTIDLRHQQNFQKVEQLFANADLIFFDGPKDILFERSVLGYIVDQRVKRRRILLFDDIRGPLVDKFWRDICFPKLDISSFGHWSGTGIVELPQFAE